MKIRVLFTFDNADVQSVISFIKAMPIVCDVVEAFPHALIVTIEDSDCYKQLYEDVADHFAGMKYMSVLLNSGTVAFFEKRTGIPSIDSIISEYI